MALSVWKFPFPFPPPGLRDEFELLMPPGAHVLTVQLQGEQPCIWALVDPAQPEQSRRW